jgi:hypothetical protein
MYHKQARGYATLAMRKYQTRKTYENYINGPRFADLVLNFGKSSLAKKPGRILKRLSKHLPANCAELQLRHWHKNAKFVGTDAITYDAEAKVHIQGDYESQSFEDDLLILNEIFLYADRFNYGSLIGATVSLTRHAIARLIEREGCVPDEIDQVIPEAMHIARHIVTYCFDKGYPSATNAFLIPYCGGAFVALNCPILQSDDTYGTRRIDGLSIRTWLSADMIRGDMVERVEALDRFLDETYYKNANWSKEDAKKALEINARAYEPHQKKCHKAPLAKRAAMKAPGIPAYAAQATSTLAYQAEMV